MIRFVHTADIHFGMENYGKIDAKTGIHTRLLDFEKALNTCIDYAIAENVDLFLFSGDAYKTAHPSPTQQKLLLNCFLRLYKAHIPVVIIVGNHDHPLSFGKATSLDIFSELPVDGFHVITKPTSLCLNTKSGLLQIVGIPWPTRNTISISNKHLLKSASQITQYISQAVSTIISDMSRKLDPQIPAVLAGHLTVSSGIFSGSEKRAIYGSDPIFLPSQLAIEPFDYVALGHLHRYQNLNTGGYPAVVYSGSIERIDFGERKEEKGFCLVTIEKKNVTTHTFIPLVTRPFIQIEVHLSETVDQTDQLLHEINKYDIRDAIVKIVYHLPPGKKDLVHIARIQQECSLAMQVIGILPVRKPLVRERRALLKIDMDFSALLSTYLDSRQEPPERKQQLLEKALELLHEAQESQEQVHD